jgi:hypothetical protein
MPMPVVDQVHYHMKKWYSFFDDLHATLNQVELNLQEFSSLLYFLDYVAVEANCVG